jgi:hypothetical protein
MNNRCVVCNEIIPEGRQVCIDCEIIKPKDLVLALKNRLHDKERRLIDFMRQLKFGEVTIKVQDGLPIMIEKTTEKVKL